MSTTASYNEKEILQRVAAGSEAAFTELFNNHQARIYSIAQLITHSETLAEEIVQDVFLSIWLKKETLLDVENFSSWLFIVTRNRAYEYLKRMARQQQVLKNIQDTIPAFESDTERLIAEKEYQEILQTALARLPEQQRQVYRLMREEGLSREEAATELKIQPHTVKTHMARALRSIRAWIRANLNTDLTD